MEIIIHGTGTMGTILKEMAEKEEKFTVTGFADELTDEKGDIIIDFSHFSRIDTLLAFAEKRKLPLVLATTGYSAETFEKIKKTAENIPVLLSSNMSLGVNLIQDILEKIVPVLYGSYDIEVVEAHHNKKIDSPSGTAKTLVEVIEKSCNEALKKQYGRESIHPREKNEIGIHSLRGGTIVGEHSVLFCGNDEILEIKHTAMSKKIFAEGALKAAEFIIDKKAGLYSMKDIFAEK